MTRLPLNLSILALLLLITLLTACGSGSNPNTQLRASFSVSPERGDVYTTYTFDASASTGTSLTYNWNFGDGNTGEGKTISHTYNADNTYTTTLTITNSSGETATATRTVLVQTSGPVPPSDVTTTSGPGFITVRWTDNSDDETGFRIYREATSSTDIKKQALEFVTEVPANQTSYTDDAIDPNFAYFYSVSAVNEEGESPQAKTNVKAIPDVPEGSFRLTVLRNGSGSGVISSNPAGITCVQRPATDPGDCNEIYSSGTQVVLSASADDNSAFAGWGGACSGSGNCVVTMDATKNVTATFVQTDSVLTIEKTGAGKGRVKSVNTGIDCGDVCSETQPTGTIIALDATPEGNAIFAGWGEPCSGTKRCFVTLDTNVTLTANFTLPPPVINTFTATPTSVDVGGNVTLSWATSGDGTMRLSIDNGVGDVTGKTSVTVNPQTSTTYTLTATTEFGTATKKVTVTVGNAPFITEFSASDTTITSGTNVDLNFEVAGEQPIIVTLTGPSLSQVVTGATSFSVSPTVTTTYTLTAVSAFGTDTKTLTITVGNAPVINSFTVVDDTLVSGATATFNFSATNATKLYITPGPDPQEVSGGSATRTVTTTTSYTLIAENDFGTTTSSPLTVTVGAAPDIVVFTANDNTVTSGSNVTFSWTITGNPTSLGIDKGVGDVTGKDDITVRVNNTATFTLTASNAFGTDTETYTITVGNAPTITSFTSSKQNVVANEQVTLSWTLAGGAATSVSIDNSVGDVTSTNSTTVKVGATTTYKLTASNAFGSATDQVTITVGNAPAITSFTANDTTVTAGTEVTLIWSVSGSVTDLSIDKGVGDVTGLSSKAVTVNATTTYTLTATNNFGSATKTLVITVGAAPSITNFTANPAVIEMGESSTLNWTVTGDGTITYEISNGVGTVAGTSKVVSPTSSVTYTLTARSEFGEDTEQVLVSVGSAPVITGFTVSDDTVTAGSTVTLTWSVAGEGVSLTLNGSPVNGTSTTVTVNETTDYTLVASNSFGSDSDTVNVTVGTAPEITNFAASDTTVVAGSEVTLMWSVSGSVTDLSIDKGVGNVTGLSSKAVTVNATTTYTLTATNAFGSDSATVSITVGTAPVITNFAVTDTTVTAGSSVTFSWNVTGVSTLSISNIGVVTGTSQTTTVNATTDYVLTASNEFGSTDSNTITVTVGTAPVIDTFTPSQTSVPAGTNVTLLWQTLGVVNTLTLDPGGIDVTGDTSYDVIVNETTTFTLTASNDFGITTKQTEVTVAAGPVIIELKADPPLITSGANSTLSWSVSSSGTPTIVITNVSNVPQDLNSSVVVSPVSSTTYEMTVTDAFGVASASVDVGVMFTLTVNKSLLGGVLASVSSSPAGLDCGVLLTSCDAEFVEGTVVTLSYGDLTGGFDGWSGCDALSGDDCVVTMDADKTVEASFSAVSVPPVANDDAFVVVQGEVLTVPVGAGVLGNDTDFSGNGLSAVLVNNVSHGSVVLASNGSFEYTPESTFSGKDNFTYYAFDGVNSSNTATVTLTVVPLPTLTVSTSAGGSVISNPAGITCPTTCSATYPPDESVTLTAVADSGFIFDSWSGCDSVSNTECSVTLSKNTNVSATFSALHTLNLTFAGTGSGSVNINGDTCTSNCSKTYLTGTNVTLIATGDSGSTFTSWGDACTAESSNTCTLTLNADTNVRVSFEPADTPPTTSGLPDVTTQEDAPDIQITLSSAFNDNEDSSSDLSYAVTNVSNSGLFSSVVVVDDVLTLVLAKNANGVSAVSVSATDSAAQSVSSTFMVSVAPVNDAPVAEAGANQTVGVGTLVTLDASASSDVDEDALLYTWAFSALPAGSGAMLSDTSGVSVSFMPDVAGEYVLGVSVTDGAFIVTDEVTVTVIP